MNMHVDPLLLDVERRLNEIAAGTGSPGYADRRGFYMHVSTARFYFPLDPHQDEIFIEDIAHGMAHQCRFNGQCRRFMSVAEHSIHASYLGPDETALERLMHDAAEAYIGDIIRPLKMIPALRDIYEPIEKLNEAAIAKRFELTYPWPPCVKRADEAVCSAEMTSNIANEVKGNLHQHIEADVTLSYWDPMLAKAIFLHRFFELAQKRGLKVEH